MINQSEHSLDGSRPMRVAGGSPTWELAPVPTGWGEIWGRRTASRRPRRQWPWWWSRKPSVSSKYFHSKYFQIIFTQNTFKIFLSKIPSKYFHPKYFQNIFIQNISKYFQSVSQAAPTCRQLLRDCSGVTGGWAGSRPPPSMRLTVTLLLPLSPSLLLITAEMMIYGAVELDIDHLFLLEDSSTPSQRWVLKAFFRFFPCMDIKTLRYESPTIWSNHDGESWCLESVKKMGDLTANSFVVRKVGPLTFNQNIIQECHICKFYWAFT